MASHLATARRCRRWRCVQGGRQTGEGGPHRRRRRRAVRGLRPLPQAGSHSACAPGTSLGRGDREPTGFSLPQSGGETVARRDGRPAGSAARPDRGLRAAGATRAPGTRPTIGLSGPRGRGRRALGRMPSMPRWPSTSGVYLPDDLLPEDRHRVDAMGGLESALPLLDHELAALMGRHPRFGNEARARTRASSCCGKPAADLLPEAIKRCQAWVWQPG